MKKKQQKMEGNKTLGLYKIVYGEDVWKQVTLFVTDRETFERYKDNYFTYTINEGDDVEEVKMKTTQLLTEDQDFIQKFLSLKIDFFDPIEEIKFREDE